MKDHERIPNYLHTIYIYIYIYMGGVWIHLFRGQGVHGRVILVLCECIWNARVVLLVHPNFDDTSSLGYPPRWVAYHPLSSTLVPASRFLAGNREGELKPTPFSSLLIFRVFLFFFFF